MQGLSWLILFFAGVITAAPAPIAAQTVRTIWKVIAVSLSSQTGPLARSTSTPGRTHKPSHVTHCEVLVFARHRLFTYVLPVVLLGLGLLLLTSVPGPTSGQGKEP